MSTGSRNIASNPTSATLVSGKDKRAKNFFRLHNSQIYLRTHHLASRTQQVAAMKLLLLILIACVFTSSQGKLNLRHICPAIKCVNPCMEYSSYLTQAKPKCSDNEVCVTKPTFFRQGRLRCTGCESFVKCEPKPIVSVDPMPCPMPACMDPCMDYDFTTGLTSPKCPESQKCITQMQYYDPNGLNCPMCPAFDHCE